MNKLEIAKEYLNKGLSIIPIKANSKEPLITWKEYTKRIAKEEEVEKWFQDFGEDINLAVVCGEISGITVIDIDGEVDVDFPETLKAITPSGFNHLIYRYQSEINNAVRVIKNTDIRNDNGYIVVFPSIIEGNQYRWANDFDRDLIKEFPSEIIKPAKGLKTNWNEIVDRKNIAGTRNDLLVQYGGKLIYHFPEKDWDTVGWESFKNYDLSANDPPLQLQYGIEDIRKKWESLKATHRHKRESLLNNEDLTRQDQKSQSQADVIFDLFNQKVQSGDIIIFKSQLDEPYVKVKIDDYWKTFNTDTTKFKKWLTGFIYHNTGKIPNKDAVSQAIDVINTTIDLNGKKHELHTRIAKLEGVIYYDLADDKSRIIRIDSNGWEIVNDAPVFFKRYSHQIENVEPRRAGDVKRLLKFINLKDKKQEILLLTLLVSYFIPGFPHPILNVHGVQGSAKSTLLKLVKKLVDPSKIETSSLKNDKDDFSQFLDHHWFVPFDNISTISGSCSDDLCRAVSGDSFSKRKLYTDDDDTIRNFQRCIGLNGINSVIDKPDLLERSVSIELNKIVEEERKTEKFIFESFECEKEFILGGIFDIVSKAMGLEPTIHELNLPRMADFAKWGCAIALAMGYSQEDFKNAYNLNIDSQNEEILNGNPLAKAISMFMEKQKVWDGTADELLKNLSPYGLDSYGSIYKQFPKAPNILMKELNRIKPNLEKIGIVISNDRLSKKRIVHIHKVQKSIDSIVSIDGTVNRVYDGMNPACKGKNLLTDPAAGAEEFDWGEIS